MWVEETAPKAISAATPTIPRKWIHATRLRGRIREKDGVNAITGMSLKAAGFVAKELSMALSTKTGFSEAAKWKWLCLKPYHVSSMHYQAVCRGSLVGIL